MIAFLHRGTPHLQKVTIGSSKPVRCIHKSRHILFRKMQHTLQHVRHLFLGCLSVFKGAYSVMGISLLKAAAIATPCARPNFNMDCTFFPKKGASIASSSGK